MSPPNGQNTTVVVDAKHVVNTLDYIIIIGHTDRMSRIDDTDYMPSIIIRDIDVALRKAFRQWCVANDTSMNAQLKKMIEKFVEEQGKKK